MAIDLQALKTEIETNPVSMPYPSFTAGNDVAISEVINNVDGTNPRTVNQKTVDTGDIRGSVSSEEWGSLVPDNESYLGWLSQNGVIPVNAKTLQGLAGIPTPTDSIWATGDRDALNAAMTALMQFEGSRAQEIEDTLGASNVTPTNVRDARLLP